MGVAFVACTFLGQPLWAKEVIKPTLDVQDLRLVINDVSTGELVKLQRKYGANVSLRDVRQGHRHGFSILRTNRETGAAFLAR